MRTIKYEDLIKNEDRYIIVDVRTPSEFEHSTIPGAINIPLLSDDDHKQVGTIYKQIGRKEATKKALELFSPRLVNMYESFDDLVVRGKEIVVFCARGGMRSTTLVSFLQTLAIPVVKLEYGYKAYRNVINSNLENLVKSKKFVTLFGNTGVGKTNILYKLDSAGYDVLDLEKFANHRGSLLGHIGLGNQTSQKMFESLVYDQLRKCGDIVFVEGESKRIGKIMLPGYLYDAVHSSYSLHLTTSIKNRVENIKADYVNEATTKEELIDAVERLRKYSNDNVVDEYISMIENNDFDLVIEELIVNYYDKRYKSINDDSVFVIEFSSEKEAVKLIIDYVNNLV